MKIVILGLSITSSWGNGHATTFRGLVRELAALGHDILFLERDVPWYASNRDMPQPAGCITELYDSVDDLRQRFELGIRHADAVIVGSYVPEGVAVGDYVLNYARGVKAFYDIDTPVTLAKLENGDYEYIEPRQIKKYDLYLSFAGGPTLTRLENEFGSPCARALYCSVDPQLYYPEAAEQRWDLGYMGTYSPDRQPPLQRLLIEAATIDPSRKFVVAGPQYPGDIHWPTNVDRIEHLAPSEHREFYCSQAFTLNITRQDMIKAGYSPSVRLFEAAACGVPIISDYWEGLDTVFEIDREILVSRSPEDTVRFLKETGISERDAIATRARRRVLTSHTSAHRAAELADHLSACPLTAKLTV